jgi:hypothetical protein
MTEFATNVRYLPDASVDLVYLDPPFNSNRDYIVIFKDESGRRSDAQLLAFEDTWHWGPSAEATYAYLTNTARHEGLVPDTVSTISAAPGLPGPDALHFLFAGGTMPRTASKPSTRSFEPPKPTNPRPRPVWPTPPKPAPPPKPLAPPASHKPNR